MNTGNSNISSSRSKSYNTDLEQLALSSISAASAGEEDALDDDEDDGNSGVGISHPADHAVFRRQQALTCSHSYVANSRSQRRPPHQDTLVPAGAPSISSIMARSGSVPSLPQCRTPHIRVGGGGGATVHSGSRTPVTPAFVRRASGSCSDSRKRRSGGDGRSSLLKPGLTPNTSTPGDQVASSCIVALTGGRGNAFGEVGLAAFDPHRPTLVLAQFSDSYTFVGVIRKISVLNPCKILIPSTFVENGKVLYASLCGEFSGDTVSTLARGHFQAAAGLHRLTSLCQPAYSGVLHPLANAYYCCSAAAALLDYLEYTKSITFRANTLKIELQSAESTAIIDCDTARRLELVVSSDPARPQHTVFSAIKRTRTASGARRLRAELLQPSTDVHSINGRLECVGELVANPELLYQLRAVVGRFQDVEKVHCFCIQQHPANAFKNVEQRLNCVMTLKTSLDVVDALRQCLQSAHNGMFVTLRSLLDDPSVECLLRHVRAVIHDDVQTGRTAVEAKLWRCYAIKSRINGLLDVARRLYTETTDTFISYVSELSEQLGLPLKPACNMSRGFHITAHIPRRMALAQLPDQLIQIQRRRDHYVFTTEKVIQLDAKAEYTVHEISKMANVIVCGLLDTLTPHLGFLYQLSEVVTCVDMMVSFAELALASGLTRPEFGNTMRVRAASHLLLTFNSHSAVVVPNDTVLDGERRLMILTGANMTGKSTYLKQVALIQILAQIGSFVPAESALVCIVDRVFYRAGHEDSCRLDLSAFTTEMRDVSRILQEASRGSLVLIDEPCRATEPMHGSALCWAVCEQLMVARCLAIVATHYPQLARLDASYYPFMFNCHLTSVDNTESADVNTSQRLADADNDYSAGDAHTHMVGRHRLMSGPAARCHYGLRAAASVGLPSGVIATARTLMDQLSLTSSSDVHYNHTAESHARLVHKLADDLILLAAEFPVSSPDGASGDHCQLSLRRKLQQLRSEFIGVQLE